jgi:adenylate cyclase
MSGRLTPVGGGPPFFLLKNQLTLGRDPNCDHVIPSAGVSGKHCELELIDGYWWVRDLGSRNGTAVNNVRCETSKILPGGILRLANLRFRLDYKEPRVRSEEDQALLLLMEPEPAAVPARSTAISGDSVAQRSGSGEDRTRQNRIDARAAGGSSHLRRFLGKLVPCGGGDPIALLQSPLLIGRRSACDITLRFPDVSSRHCTLTFEDGYWVAEDLQSRNGIRVNGERVDRKVLFPEDRISIASHRFIIHYTPEGSAPPSDEDTFSKGLLEKIGLQDLSRLDQKRIPGANEKDDDRPKRISLD